ADADADIWMIAGGAAFSGSSVGVGIASTVFVHTDNVSAIVGEFASLSTSGDTGLTVSAHSTEDVMTIAAAGAGSASSAAVAGSVAIQVMTENTLAAIGDDATITATSAGHNPGVTIAASDDTDLLAIAGSLALSGSAGVGAGVVVTTLSKVTDASFGDGSLIADGSVAITADSSEDISTFSVAAGGGSSVGVAVAADVF